ncbi:DeoR/GlpR family DNA-binding transcription regulator [Sphingomonas sp. CJ20]
MDSADTIDIPASARVSQSERLNRMLALLDERAFWSVAELAARFDVSEETIRRDVRQLEHSGRVQKTHGGVSLPSGAIEAPYRVRMREQAEAKQRIGREAARLVTPGMTLLLDSGTTSFWLARALAPMRDLSIVTNSIEIAHEVLGRPGQNLFFAGGRINSDYHAAFGADAIAYARCFVPDLTILSIGAVEAERGFLDFDADEAMFKHALLERARRVVMLADGTKFDKTGSLQVAGFGQVNDLVTDRAPPPPIARAAAAAGTTIRVVSRD